MASQRGFGGFPGGFGDEHPTDTHETLSPVSVPTGGFVGFHMGPGGFPAGPGGFPVGPAGFPAGPSGFPVGPIGLPVGPGGFRGGPDGFPARRVILAHGIGMS